MADTGPVTSYNPTAGLGSAAAVASGIGGWNLSGVAISQLTFFRLQQILEDLIT